MAFPFLRLKPALPPYKSPLSAARSLKLALAVCLALGFLSCNQGLSAPFVKLTLVGLPASTVKIDVDVTLDATMKMPTPEFVGTAASLADVSISFPADSRGVLFIALRAIDATPCLVATGSVAVVLDMNQVYPAAILAMTLATGCQNPDTLNTLTVNMTGDATGTITSSDQKINCGSTCSAMFKAGMSVTLTATPKAAPAGTTYQFVSWSGAGPGCTTLPTCQFQFTTMATVTATFRCSGFCPEAPAGLTNNLYGVWGFSPKNIVAVGDGGTILTTLSGTWAPATSGVMTPLRAVQASPDAQLGVIVGDGGVILSTTNGGVMWTQMQTTPPPSSTKPLRSVYVPSASTAYAVGDQQAPNFPYLKYAASLWTAVGQGGYLVDWNWMTGVDASTFLLLGTGIARLVTNDMASTTMPVPGVSVALNGACALSPTNIIVVGAASTLLKADMTSTQWVAMTPPQQSISLHAVFCFGGSTAYAVGDGGTVWRYEAMAWTVVPSGGTKANLNAIWGTSEADFYVVGSNGTLLHKRP